MGRPLRSVSPAAILDGEIPEGPWSPADNRAPRERNGVVVAPVFGEADADGARPDDGGREPDEESDPNAGADDGGREPDEESDPNAGADDGDRGPEEGEAAERALAAPALSGHLEHTGVFAPPSLFEAYEDLAIEVSQTLGYRVSANSLMMSLLALKVPDDVDAARPVVREWLDLRMWESDPYGHEAGVSRNLRLYPAQKAKLVSLAHQLKRAGLQGARSKLICAVLHAEKPTTGKGALQVLKDARGLIETL